MCSHHDTTKGPVRKYRTHGVLFFGVCFSRVLHWVFSLYILIYIRPLCLIFFSGRPTTEGVLLFRTHEGLQKRSYLSMPHTLIPQIHVYFYVAHTTILHGALIKRHDVFEFGSRFKCQTGTILNPLWGRSFKNYVFSDIGDHCFFLFSICSWGNPLKLNVVNDTV